MSTPLEFHCVLCNKPVDLMTDTVADEMGQAVHQQCYVSKIICKDFEETSSGCVA
jgi:hypothetical protein